MRIAVVTTSRADWASLGMVAKGLREVEHNDVVVLGIGNWPRTEVNYDGFGGARIEADHDFTKSPVPKLDMAVLCGDRHEGVHAAVELIKAGIPIAHMAGGDETVGSADNLFRHAITKLAQWHFPTNVEAGHRIVQLGEDRELVWPVGSASVDRIVETDFLPDKELRWRHGLHSNLPIALLNWQAETAGQMFDGLLEIFSAMADFPGQIVAVGPNPERGDEIIRKIMLEVENGGRIKYYDSMSNRSYLSTMKHAAFMIGNSSSGFYEAPYLGTPVINVGDRQSGRPPSANILTVAPVASLIRDRIVHVMGDTSYRVVSAPYGPPGAAAKIVEVFGMVPIPAIRKEFRWSLMWLPNEAPPIGP